MKILVPHDFSKNGSQAITFAKKLALTTNSKITLLFAYYVVYDFAAQVAEMEAQIKRDAKIKLTREIQELHNAGIDADYIIVQNSLPNAIISTAADQQIDLIIMGTKGARGIKKAIIGSNTANVIKSSTIPVLVIPSKSNFEKVQTIALAVGSLKDAPLLFEEAYKILHGFKVPYEILHVQSGNPSEENTGLRELQTLLHLSYSQTIFKISSLQNDQVIKGIDQFINDHPHSLLVMYSRQRSFIESIFNGRQSVQMAYHTHIPLLIIKE